eukprot:4556290-Pleurochrysis_carterae.AAC.1
MRSRSPQGLASRLHLLVPYVALNISPETDREKRGKRTGVVGKRTGITRAGLRPKAEHKARPQVVESYLESVRIGGCMHSLLRLGVLAALIDDVLYVHAGLVLEDGFKDGSTDCLGYVPGLPNRVPDVAEWVTKLNGWKDAQLDEWEARPEWDNPNTTLDSSDRGGHALMDYVVPGTLPSVIQSRHVDAKSMPMEMPEHLTRTLNEQNIFKMVVGHIPHGTCPTVIKSGGPGRNVPSMEASARLALRDARARARHRRMRALPPLSE